MNRHGKIADGQARVSVQLTQAEVAALKKIAKEQRRSLSNLLSVLAAEAVERDAKKRQP